MKLAFDIYAHDDLLGSPLVRVSLDGSLTRAYFRDVLHGTGEGWLEIHSDHADATEANFGKRNLVKVVDTDAADRSLGAFFLEEGDFTVLSRKERGGRVLRFGGPGAMFYLDRALLLDDRYVADQPARGSLDIDGQWTWINEPYGAILTRMLEEGQSQPGTPLGYVTNDFGRVTDSDGVAWPNINETYAVAIGTNVLDIVGQFIKAGLTIRVDANLGVHAYNAFGTDRTSVSFAAGKVRFVAGVNIAADLKRTIAPKVERSRVLARGADGEYATGTAAGAGITTDVEYYDTVEAGQTNDPDLLLVYAERNLRARKLQSDQCKFPHVPGDDEAAGEYTPGDHYSVGDLVTVHTGTDEHDYNNFSIQVSAIGYEHDAAGNWIAVPELGAEYMTPTQQRFEERVHSLVNQPGLCCGPKSPLDSQSVTLLDWQWEDGDGVEEVVPAIASLNQPAGEAPFSGGQSIVEDGLMKWNPGTSKGTLPGVSSPDVYVAIAVTPGQTYDIRTSLLSETGVDSTAAAIWPVWMSGNFDDPSPGYVEVLEDSILSVGLGVHSPTEVEGSYTAPPGATGLMFRINFNTWIEYITVGQSFVGTDPPTLGGPGDGSFGSSGHYLPADTVIEHGDLSGEGGTMHDADQVEVTPFGGIAATNVQDALEEIVAEATGVTDHGALSGLTDDDHPQYATNIEFDDHSGRHILGGADAIEIASLPTSETDTDLRLAPDGLGGVEWASGGGGASELDDLTDVDTTTDTPADGDVLTFDSGDSLWKPAAPAGGGGSGNVSTGNGAVVLPGLRDYHPSGTPIDFSSPSLDTGVVHDAVDDTVGSLIYPVNGHKYVDVASAIGTGDFDLRARVLHVGIDTGTHFGALSLSVTDAARTAGTRLSVKAYGHCSSSVVLYYTQMTGTSEAGTVLRPVRYPCIIRIARVGTTVSFYVSFTEGRTWTLVSTTTSALDVGKIGLWGHSTGGSSKVEAWVHWVRSV